MRAMFLAALAGVVTSGCQSTHRMAPTTADAPFRQASAIDPPPPAALSEQRKQEIDQMVQQILSAPDLESRAAAALAAADSQSESLRKTVHALQEAEKAVLENLQNADTTGYRATRPIRSGDKYALLIDPGQGPVESTNRPLDLAIDGDGYFAVQVPGGEKLAFTRSGNFFISSKGELVLGVGDGYVLQPTITMPEGVTDVVVAEDGTIYAQFAGQVARRAIGAIKLARFRNPERLSRAGGSLLSETTASGPPVACNPGADGAGRIHQGFLEASNVDLTRERLRLRFLADWRAAVERAIDLHQQRSPH